MTTPVSSGKTFDPRRAILLLAMGLTAIRLIAGASIHLTEDEAYYRLWAQHLQLGYFDHPPMVAWWIRVGTLICGDTPLGVRLVPALASGLNTWLIGDLARALGASPRTAFRAALWYNATITVCLGAMLAIPDAPASLFWTITLCCLARTQRREGVGWWLAAGLAAGLAVMSKYSALFLAPGVLLWLAVTPGGLKTLRRPGPWLAAAIAVVVFAPNVIWNAQNHWESFTKQFGRVAPEGLSPGHLVEFLAAQFLLLTPPIAILAGIGVMRGWKKGGVNLRLPIAASAPFAAYLLLHSLHDRVQGHWPVPLFGALAICAAVAADQLSEKPWAEWVRRLMPVPGFLALAAVLAVMALPAPAKFAKYDPMLALRGWPGFARDIEAERLRTGAAWVGTQSYGVYSQLAFEGGVHAPLLQVVERDRYWKADAPKAGGGAPDFGQPGLIVDLSRRLKAPDVGRCFTSVTPVAEINRAGSPRKNEHYSAYLVSGPRRDVWIVGCPQEIHPGVWR